MRLAAGDWTTSCDVLVAVYNARSAGLSIVTFVSASDFDMNSSRVCVDVV